MPGVSCGGDNHSVAQPQPEPRMSPLHPCPQDPLAGRMTLAGGGPLSQDGAQLQGGLEPEGLGVRPTGHQTWAESCLVREAHSLAPGEGPPWPQRGLWTGPSDPPRHGARPDLDQLTAPEGSTPTRQDHGGAEGPQRGF